MEPCLSRFVSAFDTTVRRTPGGPRQHNAAISGPLNVINQPSYKSRDKYDGGLPPPPLSNSSPAQLIRVTFSPRLEGSSSAEGCKHNTSTMNLR